MLAKNAKTGAKNAKYRLIAGPVIFINRLGALGAVFALLASISYDACLNKDREMAVYCTVFSRRPRRDAKGAKRFIPIAC
jgi:hypothetical protein